MAGIVKLSSRSQTSRARTNNRHSLAGANGRGLRFYPTGIEGAIDDRLFDSLDCHRTIVDAEYARALAWRGTNSACEFRKVISLMKPIESFTPASAIDQIVPFGDQVVDGTTGGSASQHVSR